MAKDTTKITRLSDLSTGRSDLLNLPPNVIHIEEGFNYRNFKLRQNKEHLAEIKESIRVNGVMEPLWVRFDTENRVPVLIDGETRLKAVLELIAEGMEIKSVPCIQKKGSPADILLLSLLSNTGKPPSQWEVGTAYQRLVNFGWTEEDIATKMGQKPAYVKAALALNEATPEVKQLLSEAAVTPSHAVTMIKKHGGQASLIIQTQVKAARDVAAAKAKEREEKKAAAEAAGKKSKGGRPAKADKPVTVKREKKAGGKFIKDSILKVIVSALKAASGSDNVDISMTADTALEELEAVMKDKE